MRGEEREGKWFRCRNGHALGRVIRNGRGRRQLLLLREALDLEQPGGGVETMACVEGAVVDVVCSLCGAVRTWVPGRETILWLIERQNGE